MGKFFGDWNTQYKGYNSNVRLFLLSSILGHIGMGIFMIIYNYYIRELGFDEQVNGKVIAMTATAQAIMLLPAGILSDRIGRKKVIFIGGLLSAIVFLSRAIFVEESLLLTAAFLSGIFMAFIQVSTIPLLAENSNEKQRVHLFSFNFAIMMVASVIGNMLGGSLSDGLQTFLSLDGVTSIRITLIIGALFFFSSLIPIVKIRERKKTVTEVKERKSYLHLLKTNKGVKIILLFAVAQLIIGFGSGLVIPYLNLYFTDRFEVSKSLVGVILSLGQAMTAVAMLIGPLVVSRFGEVRAVVILQLSSIPFLLLTAFTENLLFAVLGFLFRQALMNAGNPIQMSLMMRSVDDSMKGLANSVGQMVFSLGWAVMGPVSTGIVMLYGSYYGYAYVFSITAALYVIGSVYFFLVFRNVDKQKVEEVSITTKPAG
ncbi:MFS transporter [Anaerobacillus alkaliphilus]|uniref:MFS transporter n=1 Tax=Anaerobacillus alkaliphilus TaxID=1548597 RepID=A0A4Q0VWC2_9BACI|nr:MFS transporter [Anaerobacillus alkaliphilus]RXJ01790.1 MFS transporter [Anaerobacillus alkaliphilus]